jgi:hypothetical protein
MATLNEIVHIVWASEYGNQVTRIKRTGLRARSGGHCWRIRRRHVDTSGNGREHDITVADLLHYSNTYGAEIDTIRNGTLREYGSPRNERN